ncbi:MAG: CPBP family intramembrane glutamate endopeptidase, partial [Flavobacterium sp.]
MYIEQIKNKKFIPALYLIVILGFFGLMGANFILSEGVDSNAMINQLIQQVGTNIAFVLVVIPLSLMCLGLLFWVRFIHGQSLRSFTTGRPKIDWSRFFFSFSLWAGVCIVTTVIGYFLAPEDFVFNYKPQPFFIFLILAVILIPLQTSFE